MKPDICANKHGGADTSVQAFKGTPAEVRQRMRDQICQAIAAAGVRGATADEIVVTLGIPLQTTAARFSELKRDGRIVRVGSRPTRLGRPARVYVVPTPKPVQRLLWGGVESEG